MVHFSIGGKRTAYHYPAYSLRIAGDDKTYWVNHFTNLVHDVPMMDYVVRLSAPGEAELTLNAALTGDEKQHRSSPRTCKFAEIPGAKDEGQFFQVDVVGSVARSGPFVRSRGRRRFKGRPHPFPRSYQRC
jgi:hypothetical protein